jgi:hypothetical protein
MRYSPVLPAALIALVASAPAASPAESPSLPYHRLARDLAGEARLLALAPGLEGAGLTNLLDRLEAAGYEVPVAVSGAGLVVVDRPGIRTALGADGGVTDILSGPAPSARGSAPTAERGLLRWWNEGFEAVPAPPPGRETVSERICNGARTLEEAIAERGGAPGRCGPGASARVHFVQGRSVVSLVFPESQGAQSIDEWTATELEACTSELVRALNWWNLKSGGSATFVLVDHGPVACQTEPALVPIEDELDYLDECVASLGYPTPCAYEGLGELNADARAQHNAHWAWTQFILDASSFAGSDGVLAYAYLGGPHTVALRGNGSLGTAYLDRVLAHEMGHIYQAADEYSGGCGGCGGEWGYLRVPNDNCVSCARQEGSCVMRGGGEYSYAEMDQMETHIDACRFTRGMVGLADEDHDGLWDVLATRPATVFESFLPDTLEASENALVTGRTWDVPYPAPARFGEPQTINRILRGEYSIDGGLWRLATAADGFFTEVEEELEVRLPELGGGRHTLRIRGVNTVGRFDNTPPVQEFFVYDVRLRRELSILPLGGYFRLEWQVDGEDFGSTYRLFRQATGGEWETVKQIRSGGRPNERHLFRDYAVQAGLDYVYRLEVDVPGKGRKALGTVTATANLAPPSPGHLVRVAPNPARGSVLFTVTVPWGPRPGQGDVIFPGGAAGARGGRDDDSGSGGDDRPSSPQWREARLVIHDVLGRHVRDLGSVRERELERFNASWDGRNGAGEPMPSGVYFLTVDFGYERTSERLVLLR